MDHRIETRDDVRTSADVRVADRPSRVDPAILPRQTLSGPLAARAATAPRGLVPVGIVVVGYVLLTLTLIGVGAAITSGGWLADVRAWDEDVARWFVDQRTSTLNALTAAASRTADTLSVVAIAAVVEVILLAQRRWWALLLTPVALGLELGTFLTVNAVVGRPRPELAPLGSQPSTSSFPSGHTAATVVVWGAMFVLFVWSSTRRPVRIAGAGAVVIMIVAVGTSRVYRGMHHPTDVLCGALMGLAALAIALLAVRTLVGEVQTRRRDAERLAPTDPSDRAMA